MAIKAVFFDAAGTLIKPARRVGESYAEIAKKYGMDVSPSAVSERFRACFEDAPALTFPDARPEHIRTLEIDWWKQFVERVFESWIPICNFDDFFMTLFQYFARAEAWTLYPDARETLSALKERGLIVDVISNFDSRLFGILEGLGVRTYFQHIFISSRIGWAKPAREIFEFALNAYNIKPRAAIHVGDDLDADVRGASDAGLKPILFARSMMAHNDSIHRIRNLKELLSVIDREQL